KAQAIMWSIGLLLKARIIPPEEGLVTTVCERIFKQTLNPVTFNNFVIGLISDGLILKNRLLPGHPSYVEEDFLDKDLSIYFTALKEILKDRRRTEELYGLAAAFYFNKNYSEGVDILDFVLSEIDPKNAIAWTGKGAALGRLGKDSEALDCYNKALEIDPKNAIAWFGKGMTLGLLGEKDEAGQCFKRAKELGFEPPSKK
ncbi:MAG: tetratricopeptide repeat protein, partial [Planctomycetota bacterium]